MGRLPAPVSGESRLPVTLTRLAWLLWVASLVALGLFLAIPEVTLSVVLVPRNVGYLVGAFGFGIVVSILSGAYPAWKAATDRPVDALRG